MDSYKNSLYTYESKSGLSFLIKPLKASTAFVSSLHICQQHMKM